LGTAAEKLIISVCGVVVLFLLKSGVVEQMRNK